MFKKDKLASDNFVFSLGGMTTVSPFAAMPAIAHDRLRQVQDDGARNASERKWRLRVPRLFRTA
jgi:hypothetical protein